MVFFVPAGVSPLGAPAGTFFLRTKHAALEPALFLASDHPSPRPFVRLRTDCAGEISGPVPEATVRCGRFV